METCRIFQRSKGTSTTVELYQPLTITTRPWESCNMDFLMGLLRSQKENDRIYVVVDRFSKLAHFISCKRTNDASENAILFFKEIFRIHLLPQTILSKKDMKFIVYFWRTVWKKLGTNLSFSSTYHPQTDGKIELVNKYLGNILRFLKKKYRDKWELGLPKAEFSFNDSVNRSIGKSPFHIVYGQNPRDILKLSELASKTLISAHGEKFIESTKEIHDSVRVAPEKSVDKYKQEKDNHRRDVQL